MRKIIDPYTFRLVKQNLIYFFSFLIFILLAIFVLPAQIRDHRLFKEKNEVLARELGVLERKRLIISSFDTDEIERLLLTINALLPQKEDHFSIFPALENLAQLTNVRMSSFTLPFGETQSDKLSLTVTIEGSPEALLDFLGNYQYKGGRLMTVEQIIYSPTSSQTSLVLNFHAKEIQVASTDQIPNIDKNRLNLIKTINEELSGVIGASALEEEIKTDYPAKDNPFDSL